MSFQARALCIKTLQWQRRHKCQLMANLCFPIFICLIALLIEVLLVSVIREETLCGTGIKYKNCKEKGYNLSCVENLLSQQYKIKDPYHYLSVTFNTTSQGHRDQSQLWYR